MTNASTALSLATFRQMLVKNGVNLLLVKELAPNDNTKNQLYLSGSIESLNILPMGTIREERTEKGNLSLKAPVSFYWLQSDGGTSRAPGAQLILYPQYPEVRLSGFLRGTKNAPNLLLNRRGQGRLLFFGLTRDGRIVAWATEGKSRLASEYRALGTLEQRGVFYVVPLSSSETGLNTRSQLLQELCRIHNLGWINSKALSSDGTLRACNAPNCVGYTLEAELGIARNGRSEPDYKGWEIKAGVVNSFEMLPASKAITLMTPEPTGGLYRTDGVDAFIRKFGYADKKGRNDRINFGGIFRYETRHELTKLTLHIDGFDKQKGKITKVDGCLALLTDTDAVAAEWSFASLMNIWSRKHAQAAYVPALARATPNQSYRYGSQIRLGTGTDFVRLLTAVSRGIVYYDPGIKLENASSKDAKIKRRSQFRTNSRELAALYKNMTILNSCD